MQPGTALDLISFKLPRAKTYLGDNCSNLPESCSICFIQPQSPKIDSSASPGSVAMVALSAVLTIPERMGNRGNAEHRVGCHGGFPQALCGATHYGNTQACFRSDAAHHLTPSKVQAEPWPPRPHPPTTQLPASSRMPPCLQQQWSEGTHILAMMLVARLQKILHFTSARGQEVGGPNRTRDR